jgi:hypothetical protein
MMNSQNMTKNDRAANTGFVITRIAIGPSRDPQEPGQRLGFLEEQDRIALGEEVSSVATPRQALILKRGKAEPSAPLVFSPFEDPCELDEEIGPVPLLSAPQEVHVWVAQADGVGEPVPGTERELAFTVKPDDRESSGLSFRDDGAPFPSSNEPKMWMARETFSCTWAMEENIRIGGAFDPSRLVLPFATCVDALGQLLRFLLPDRAEYDGRPLPFKIVEDLSAPLGIEQSCLDGEGFPEVWLEGPDWREPYRGPWKKFDDELRPAFLVRNPQYANADRRI